MAEGPFPVLRVYSASKMVFMKRPDESVGDVSCSRVAIAPKFDNDYEVVVNKDVDGDADDANVDDEVYDANSDADNRYLKSPRDAFLQDNDNNDFNVDIAMLEMMMSVAKKPRCDTLKSRNIYKSSTSRPLLTKKINQ